MQGVLVTTYSSQDAVGQIEEKSGLDTTPSFRHNVENEWPWGKVKYFDNMTTDEGKSRI